MVFRYADRQHPNARFDREAHHAKAAEFAGKCAVLLQNNGVLPLKKGAKTAYIGAFAQVPRYHGGGSSHVHAHRVVGALGLAGDGVTYAQGFTAEGEEADEALIAQAVETARAAETAVIFAGLPDRRESEGYDRADMRLPACQNELIRRVAAVQPRTVVVLHVGSPVECPWAGDVAAVLCMYLGGEGVGEATHRLLYGETAPSGRLPESWPLKLEDNPSYLNFPGDGETVRYAEEVFVGYRYYDKKRMAVRWPFGHGLGYTEFSYGEIRLSGDTVGRGGTLEVTVPVTNIGSRPGTEAVQLYVADRTGAFGLPEKELKGFAKVTLGPGETGQARFVLNERSFACYSENLSDWYAPAGRYEILAGASSRDIRGRTSVTVDTGVCLPMTLDENTTFGELAAHPATAPALAELLGQMKGALGDTGDEEAISAEMSRKMIENAPLRATRGFTHLPDEAIRDMIALFNQLLGH